MIKKFKYIKEMQPSECKIIVYFYVPINKFINKA